jgi:inosine-uridine nucleoside N-ribohydrolase
VTARPRPRLQVRDVDDALALLMLLHREGAGRAVVGVSSVFGNAPVR